MSRATSPSCPRRLAADFARFCQLNPKPCPLLAQSEPGDPRLPTLGEDLDIRTDIPLYRVWKNGELVEEITDLKKVWRDDLVSFVLGCSFSFEEALIENGLELRHNTCNSNVPMYRTNIECRPAGPFHGPMVVSMRPFTPANAIRAVQVTTRFPSVHGAPVHLGKPELIGIKDIAKPDYGDAVPVRDDELPVFWGLRRHPAIGRGDGETGILHYPRAGLHAGDRSAECAARDPLDMVRLAFQGYAKGKVEHVTPGSKTS